MAYEQTTELLKLEKNSDTFQVVTKVENKKGGFSIDLRNHWKNPEGVVVPLKKGIRFSDEDILDVVKSIIKCLETHELEELQDEISELLENDEDE